MRPFLLDTFSGGGGAGMGYHRAGFDVLGIDRESSRPDRGACRMTAPCVAIVAAGTDLWFGSESEQARAKAICAGCPTRASCLAGALQRGEQAGVWGGRSFEPAAVFVLLEPTAENLAPSETPHGERSRYCSGCRCAPCTASNTAYIAGRPRNPVVTGGEIVEPDPQLNLLEMIA